MFLRLTKWQETRLPGKKCYYAGSNKFYNFVENTLSQQKLDDFISCCCHLLMRQKIKPLKSGHATVLLIKIEQFFIVVENYLIMCLRITFNTNIYQNMKTNIKCKKLWKD
jgi:hypothetical protein